MPLRDYQLDILHRLGDAWKQYRSVMVQMPTGTGKTHLMAAVIRQHADGGVLVVAHRRELIAQISQTLDVFGIGNGIFGTAESRGVVVASIQKLSGRIREVVFEPSLVIIDEAHHALAKTYRMLWDRWPRARFLGLTATPCRLSGEAFTDFFQTLLQSWSIQEFIDKGYLSDFEYVSASPDSMALRQIRSLKKRGADGDYQSKELATVMDVPESIEHLYRTYKQFARGKKGIVYAIDQQHARHIAEYYGGMGVACAVINAKTPAEKRSALVTAYREGGLKVLVNVDIFSEGFDCPEVEFIQLARPTLSLSKYLQQVGRGMRISEGKDHVLILDNVGLYLTFGLPTDERDWQAYYRGRARSKGIAMRAAPIILRDGDGNEKQLATLEMIRIRRRSEKPKGLAIYLQNGKYGVVKDGKVTTQPVFAQIDRCQDGPFYAYGTYPYQLYQNRKTVIDQNGKDMGVQLYGDIELRGEFLYGRDIKGERVMWDTVGRRYFHGKEPKFERMGGFDLISVGNSEYELRYAPGLHLFRFRKSEMFYNQHIAIIRNKLIVRDVGYRVFTIFGYWNDKVLVCGKTQYSTIPVAWNGQIGTLQKRFPNDYTLLPNIEKLHLRSLSSNPVLVLTGTGYRVVT